jgi:hypothetical protein
MKSFVSSTGHVCIHATVCMMTAANHADALAAMWTIHDSPWRIVRGIPVKLFLSLPAISLRPLLFPTALPSHFERPSTHFESLSRTIASS